MSCRSTLEPWRSSRQLAIACWEIGAKRSARIVSAASLSHFSASLSAFSVPARASTSRACSSQARSCAASSCQAVSRRSSSACASSRRPRAFAAACASASSSVAAGRGAACASVQRARRRDHHRSPRLLELGLPPPAPGRPRRRRRLAHRARLAVPHLQGLAQQGGELGRARRVGLRRVVVRPVGDPEALERRADLLVGGDQDVRRAPQLQRVRGGRHVEQRGERDEVRRLGLQQRRRVRGAQVLHRLEPGDQRGRARRPPPCAGCRRRAAFSRAP